MGRSSSGPGRRMAGAALAAAVLVAVLAWAVTGSRRAPGPAESPPVRVAILPFHPPAGTPAVGGHAAIAEQVLLRLDS